MSTRFSLSTEMSRLTRDGTTEPVSRDQILRRERGQGTVTFPVQLTTSRIDNLTRLILTLAICDDHTSIELYTHTSVLDCRQMEPLERIERSEYSLF